MRFVKGLRDEAGNRDAYPLIHSAPAKNVWWIMVRRRWYVIPKQGSTGEHGCLVLPSATVEKWRARVAGVTIKSLRQQFVQAKVVINLPCLVAGHQQQYPFDGIFPIVRVSVAAPALGIKLVPVNGIDAV